MENFPAVDFNKTRILWEVLKYCQDFMIQVLFKLWGTQWKLKEPLQTQK